MQIDRLPRREREIAEIVHARGEASAAEVCDAVSDPLSNAAVRSMLTRLEAKGVLRRRKEGRRFLYAPADREAAAREAALRRLCREWFGGSLVRTAAAAIELAKAELDTASAAERFQPTVHTHQPKPIATARASAARQSGAARIGSMPSGMSRDPDSIGPSRLSRLNSA